MANKVQARRYCIFCGGSPLSKEHFFAEWMHDYLPPKPSTHFVADGDLKARPGKMFRPGNIFERHLRVVCVACNTGWMSELQNDAKPTLIPLMQGSWSALTPKEERTIGAWATMFAMVVERSRENLIVSPEEQRRFLRKHKTPPKNWHVWLALLSSPHCSFAQTSFGPDQNAPVAADLTRNAKAQETTIVLGRLVLNAFAYSQGDDLENRTIAALRTNAKGGGFRQIWPVRKILARTAPSTTLTMRDLRWHRGRIYRMLTGVWPLMTHWRPPDSR